MFDYESALRICAQAHHNAGQHEIAKLFEFGALREKCLKYYMETGNPHSFDEYLAMRRDSIPERPRVVELPEI
jgi:hypothetical protein